MTVDTAAMDALARRLLRGRVGILNASELDAVLTWLSGGQRHGALQLSVTLGWPDNSPQTVVALYERLDRQLLAGGRLDTHSAQLADRDLSEGERKARFRRLIQAFHPDRYPALADWLTPRAQLIHQSYAAFKRGEPLPSAPIKTAAPAAGSRAFKDQGRPKTTAERKPDHPWQPGPYRRSARLVPEGSGPRQRMLMFLRRSPRLAGALVAGLGALALTPLVLIYLADERANAAGSPSTTVVAANAAHPVAAVAVQDLARITVSEGQLQKQDASVQGITTAAPRDIAQADSPAPSQRARAADGPADRRSEPVAAETEIERLLQRFGGYVSGGDLDALLRLIDRSQASGDDPLVERYQRIISGSRRRHQEFQVLSIEHQPPYWSVQALSRLTMAFDDLTAQYEESRYRVIIRQAEDGQLSIADFDG